MGVQRKRMKPGVTRNSGLEAEEEIRRQSFKTDV